MIFLGYQNCSFTGKDGKSVDFLKLFFTRPVNGDLGSGFMPLTRNGKCYLLPGKDFRIDDELVGLDVDVSLDFYGRVTSMKLL